jgi:hypothetical protein
LAFFNNSDKFKDFSGISFFSTLGCCSKGGNFCGCCGSCGGGGGGGCCGSGGIDISLILETFGREKLACCLGEG